MPIAALTLITFLGIWGMDIKAIHKEKGLSGLKAHPIYNYTIFIISMIALSIWIVNSDIFSGELGENQYLLMAVCGLISLLISGLWFQHINKLDVFEPEKPMVLFGVFATGSITIFLVFPLSDFFQAFILSGFNGGFVNDLLYSIAGIGIIEEFVKILPIILLARFTKILNEPFDYLLFGTVSALGFAFVENSMYLFRTELNAIDGRALYASPAHMIMTSYICYQWAMSKYKDAKFNVKKVVIAFFVSAIAHGLYDFWLISSSAKGFWFISIILLLVGMKIWVRLANNLINISNYFESDVRFDPNEHKYNLTFLLVAILALTYVIKSTLFGSDAANVLLLSAIFEYSFLMAFIGINFSNIVIIQNYIAPIIDKTDYTVAQFVPLGINKDSCSGERVKIFLSDGMRMTNAGKTLSVQLPVKGKLLRRVVVNHNYNYYFFKPDKELLLPGVWSDAFIIENLDNDRRLNSKTSVLATFYGLNSKADLTTSEFDSSMMEIIQNVRCKGFVTRH